MLTQRVERRAQRRRAERRRRVARALEEAPDEPAPPRALVVEAAADEGVDVAVQAVGEPGLGEGLGDAALLAVAQRA